MKNHDLEDFKLPFNSEENLNAIKSHIKFNNQKKDEYIAELLLEKQAVKKQHKRTIISLVIMFLITLFGSNAMTHFFGKMNTLDKNRSDKIIMEYLENNFESYYDYSLSTKTIGQKYYFSIYLGINDDIMTYVYFLTSPYRIYDYELFVELKHEENIFQFKKEKKELYAIGNIDLNLNNGEKIYIKIYENDSIFETGNIMI